MEDFSSNSLVLDDASSLGGLGGGKQPSSEPESVRDAVAAAAAEMDKEEAPKPEPEPKEALKDDTKAEVKGKAEAKVEAEPKEDKPEPSEEGGDNDNSEEAPDAAEKKEAAEEGAKDKWRPTPTQAPKGFLPDSVEKWRNVPHPVARDIHVMIGEHERQLAEHRESTERYSRLRDFDELARTNGRDLRESLMQVHQFENMMRENPIAALNMALQQVGPRKADGQAVSLYEIAQHIVQNGPDAYQQMAAHRQEPQQREDPRLAQAQHEMAQMQETLIEQTVIKPFIADHPRYEELKAHIAMFLKSGMIPGSLSLPERLALAYDMAARLNPASEVKRPSASEDEQAAPRAAQHFGGDKSIKSSPGSVTEEVEDRAAQGESILDSVRKEARRLRRA